MTPALPPVAVAPEAGPLDENYGDENVCTVDLCATTTNRSSQSLDGDVDVVTATDAAAGNGRGGAAGIGRAAIGAALQLVCSPKAWATDC